jgi:hypothetical protein
MSLDRTRVRVPAHVVFKPFPAETVVLDLKSGLYHGLNPTGGRMLDVLSKASSIREAGVTLALEYGVELARVERDIMALCDGLVERGLIEYEEADSA